MKTKPASPTDPRDSIKLAYRQLRQRGYYCRSNFWCCSTCALAAIPEGRGDKYVFYHAQDAADLHRERACHLAWGGDGHEIVAALRAAGLTVEWDGAPEHRIYVSLA